MTYTQAEYKASPGPFTPSYFWSGHVCLQAEPHPQSGGLSTLQSHTALNCLAHRQFPLFTSEGNPRTVPTASDVCRRQAQALHSNTVYDSHRGNPSKWAVGRANQESLQLQTLGRGSELLAVGETQSLLSGKKKNAEKNLWETFPWKRNKKEYINYLLTCA